REAVTAADGLEHAVADAELVVVASPIAQLPATVAAVLAAPGDATVTDVGSTKSSVVAAAAGSARLVGGHPICGSETRGAENASAGLFEGATWFLTPVAQTDPDRHRLVHGFLTDRGGTPGSIDAPGPRPRAPPRCDRRRCPRPARRADEPRAARSGEHRRQPDRRLARRGSRAADARRRLAARHDPHRRREPTDLDRHLPRQRRAHPRRARRTSP